MRIVLLLVSLMIASAALAIDPEQQLKDPVLQERYRQLNDEFRCLVCQNQTIADSNAGLAKDLREQVATMLLDGKSDEEIVAYMTDRYGDFVLYRPPVKRSTYILWIGPFVILIIALFFMFRALQRHARASDAQDIEDDS